jgi:hypothetical protein
MASQRCSRCERHHSGPKRAARRACAFVIAFLWLDGAAGACSSHVPEYAFDDGGETGTDDAQRGSFDVAGEASDGESESVAPPFLRTHVRFALWWPDMPAADFCLAPLVSDTDAGDANGEDAGGEPTWRGPIVSQAATEVDGGIGVFADAQMPGLTFPQVSTYFEMPAGAYRLRAVLAGASDCSVRILPDETLSALGRDDFTTVAVVGHLAPTIVAVEPLKDDTSAASRSAALRFVAALTSGASLSLGIGTPGSPGFEPLFTGVPFGQAGDQADTDAGKVDDNSYLSIHPLADATLTTTVAGGADSGEPVIVAEGVSIASGSVATLVALADPSDDPLAPPQLLLCLDTAPAVGVVFADCRVLDAPAD